MIHIKYIILKHLIFLFFLEIYSSELAESKPNAKNSKLKIYDAEVYHCYNISPLGLKRDEICYSLSSFDVSTISNCSNYLEIDYQIKYANDNVTLVFNYLNRFRKIVAKIDKNESCSCVQLKT